MGVFKNAEADEMTDAAVMAVDAIMIPESRTPEVLHADLEELLVFTTEEQPEMVGLRLKSTISGQWLLSREFVSELVRRAQAGNFTMMLEGDFVASASGDQKSHMSIAVTTGDKFVLSLKAGDFAHFLKETALDEAPEAEVAKEDDDAAVTAALDAELAKIFSTDEV
jgi:hypothetical protein